MSTTTEQQLTIRPVHGDYFERRCYHVPAQDAAVVARARTHGLPELVRVGEMLGVIEDDGAPIAAVVDMVGIMCGSGIGDYDNDPGYVAVVSLDDLYFTEDDAFEAATRAVNDLEEGA